MLRDKRPFTFATVFLCRWLDRIAQIVWYRPLSTDRLSTTKAVMPVLETLLVGSGSGSSKLTGVSFSGISFQHATWCETHQVLVSFEMLSCMPRADLTPGNGGLLQIPRRVLWRTNRGMPRVVASLDRWYTHW